MAETITGDLREWGKVTLDFTGPVVSETSATNPFTDYRLDVTFRNDATGQTLVVPGFFAADGKAADSHATAGDVWRAHFAPPDEGVWTYTASFRAGANVAAADNLLAGASAGFFDGANGAFTVAASDAAGAGFRAKGALQYAGDNHYRFAETGEAFLKGGAGSPENFLAYGGFDNTDPTHAYAPHVGDWSNGDPTWDGGDGKGIIGAINYLASAGMNSLYFLTMNVGGDGDDVSPWITNDAANVTRYDVSKLAQWEVLFEHMGEKGVMMHVVTQETENDQLLDGGALGEARRIYYRELIARFGDNPGLQWNLGEENSNTEAERRAFADYIRTLDPYDHPIVVHTYPGAEEGVFGSLLGGAQLGGVSLQTNATHAMTIDWIDRSNAAGHPWAVSLDEIGPAHLGVATDASDPSHDAVRTQHLWGNLMAGGAGVEWYFGYSEPHNDLNLEDFRSRAEMWRQTDVALDFFNDYLPFAEMSHADELTPALSDYVLAKPGSVYAIYLPNGGEATLIDLSGQPGRYEVKWYDPRSGGALQEGTVSSVAGGAAVALGAAPHDLDQDWAILLRRLDGAEPNPPPPTPNPPTPNPPAPNPPPAAEPSDLVLDEAVALTGALGAQRWGEVTVSATNWMNEPVLVTITSDGLGAQGGRFDGQIDHDHATGASETLRLDFADAAEAATVRLGRMFLAENGPGGPEVGAWRAYDASGALVGEGAFDPRQGTPAGVNAYDFRIDPAQDFTRLDLAARPYGNGTANAADSSEYALLRIAVGVDPETGAPAPPPAAPPPAGPPPTGAAAIVLDGAVALTGALGAQRWGEVEVSARSWAGEPALLVRTSDGLGVQGGRFDGQIDHDPSTGASETLRLDVGGPADAATIRLGRMFPIENGSDGPEVGAWSAYDASGALIDHGVFHPRQGSPGGSNIYDFRIDPARDFTRLDLTARPYGDATGHAAGESSEYSLLRAAFTLSDGFARLNSATLLDATS